MFKGLFYFFAVFMLAQASAVAEVATYQLDDSNSKLTFSVDSTLHAVHGRATSLSGEVYFDGDTGSVALPLEISIPVASLSTDHKKRDRNMLKMFESEKYPAIRWQAREVSCEPSSLKGEILCEANGQLRIRNIEREASFKVALSIREKSVRAIGEWNFDRKDFELKTPSVLGIIRVAKQVDIQFDTHWIKKD